MKKTERVPFDKAFEKIHVFTKQSEVIDLLGAPGDNQGSTWHYRQDDGAQTTRLTIEFKGENVIRAVCEKLICDL
jgi:hypothetical protein